MLIVTRREGGVSASRQRGLSEVLKRRFEVA
jgi:ribosomal protein S18